MVAVCLTISTLAALGAAAANVNGMRVRSNPVDITSDVKQINTTAGNVGVSAAGKLSPFGNMALGCGINWAQDSSFGGAFCVTRTKEVSREK